MHRSLRLLSSVLLALLAGAATAQPLTLRAIQQAGSLVKYIPNGDPARPGLCREIMDAVVRTDPDIRFTGLEFVPLKRIERMLRDGTTDVMFCLLNSPTRSTQWRYLPVPLYTVRHVVVQQRDNPRQIDRLSDLKHLKRPVVVVRGTSLARFLLDADVPFTEVSSESESVQMLALRRADYLYGQDVNLQYHIHTHRLEQQLKLGSTVFQEEAQYVVVRADLPEPIVERLTQVLRKLEREGTLRQIADRYR